MLAAIDGQDRVCVEGDSALSPPNPRGFSGCFDSVGQAVAERSEIIFHSNHDAVFRRARIFSKSPNDPDSRNKTNAATHAKQCAGIALFQVHHAYYCNAAPRSEIGQGSEDATDLRIPMRVDSAHVRADRIDYEKLCGGDFPNSIIELFEIALQTENGFSGRAVTKRHLDGFHAMYM